MASPESAPIVVDPVMLGDSQVNDNDDSDDQYEYEYHNTETESFYVNLDLTSYHGPIRPPRRRHESSGSARPTTPASRLPPPPPSTVIGGSLGPSVPSRSAPNDIIGNEVDADDDNDDNDNNDNNDNDDDDDDAVRVRVHGTDRHDADAAEPETTAVVQILDLHSRDPIVTYQNHVFTCTWADLLGTELLFTTSPQHGPGDCSSQNQNPNQNPNPSSVKNANAKKDDYNLIAANSVKLLGRRANLISNSSSSSAFPSLTPRAGGNTNTNTTTTPPQPQTNQSRFLQRLANVKRSKGETDTVRTVFSAKRAQNVVEDRLHGWARTEEQMAEIQRLSHAASLGDGGAVVQLEDLSGRLGLRDITP